MLHIPADDHMCSAEAQMKIFDSLGQNSNVVLHTHEGAGHGFARRNGNNYREVAVSSADAQTLKFRKQHLSLSGKHSPKQKYDRS